MKKRWTVFLTALISSSTLANITFPVGCEAGGTKASDNEVILSPGDAKSTHVYLIYNNSPKTLVLNHMPKHNPGMSAGWGSILKQGHWSAILINRPDFNMSCTEVDGGFNKTWNCNKVLDICQLDPKNTANLGAQGSYWITENQTLQTLYPSIRSRGIRTPQ